MFVDVIDVDSVSCLVADASLCCVKRWLLPRVIAVTFFAMVFAVAFTVAFAVAFRRGFRRGFRGRFRRRRRRFSPSFSPLRMRLCVASRGFWTCVRLLDLRSIAWRNETA